ncbi:hypothetical protein MPSEU_000896800 [Mayamaea pseudoterrestris]|nr:hypothetical protein MPSEU_000896800 [Mayamaea pseudoterrestris]
MGATSSKARLTRPPDNEIHTEEMILEQFGDAYDLEQHNQTESDQFFDVDNPYRAIRQWHFSDAKGNVQQIPPFDHMQQAIKPDTVLRGWLQPSNINDKNKKVKPIYVAITLSPRSPMDGAFGIAFDRTKLFRGFWVMRPSDEPIYWLQEPDLSVYTEVEMLPYRAFIAVTSNIFDFLNSHRTAAKQTVTQILSEHHDAFSVALLRNFTAYCVKNLNGSLPGLTPGCPFFKSVCKLKPKNLDADYLLKLTLEAEGRSQQYPWGQSRANTIGEISDVVSSDNAADYAGPNSARSLNRSTKRGETLEARIAKPPMKEITKRRDHDDDKDSPIVTTRKKPKMEIEEIHLSTKKTVCAVAPKSAVTASKRGVASRSGTNRPRAIKDFPAKKRRRKKEPVELPGPDELDDDGDRLQGLQRALNKLSSLGFLVPMTEEPRHCSANEWWKELQHNRAIRIKDSSAATKALKLAEDWNVVTDSEYCMILLEAFRQRFHFESARRKSSQTKKVAHKVFRDFIFDKWDRDAMSWINDSIIAQKLPPENAVQLLCSLLLFVGEHEDIQTEGHLRILVSSRNIDLPSWLAKIHRFVYAISRVDLTIAYELAISRVTKAQSLAITLADNVQQTNADCRVPIPQTDLPRALQPARPVFSSLKSLCEKSKQLREASVPSVASLALEPSFTRTRMGLGQPGFQMPARRDEGTSSRTQLHMERRPANAQLQLMKDVLPLMKDVQPVSQSRFLASNLRADFGEGKVVGISSEEQRYGARPLDTLHHRKHSTTSIHPEWTIDQTVRRKLEGSAPSRAVGESGNVARSRVTVAMPYSRNSTEPLSDAYGKNLRRHGESMEPQADKHVNFTRGRSCDQEHGPSDAIGRHICSETSHSPQAQLLKEKGQYDDARHTCSYGKVVEIDDVERGALSDFGRAKASKYYDVCQSGAATVRPTVSCLFRLC